MTPVRREPDIGALKDALSTKRHVTFVVRTRPDAAASRFTACMEDGSWKIDVAAPADGGKANAELVAFLAETFGVARPYVTILTGQNVRTKIIRVARS